MKYLFFTMLFFVLNKECSDQDYIYANSIQGIAPNILLDEKNLNNLFDYAHINSKKIIFNSGTYIFPKGYHTPEHIKNISIEGQNNVKFTFENIQENNQLKPYGITVPSCQNIKIKNIVFDGKNTVSQLVVIKFKDKTMQSASITIDSCQFNNAYSDRRFVNISSAGLFIKCDLPHLKVTGKIQNSSFNNIGHLTKENSNSNENFSRGFWISGNYEVDFYSNTINNIYPAIDADGIVTVGESESNINVKYCVFRNNQKRSIKHSGGNILIENNTFRRDSLFTYPLNQFSSEINLQKGFGHIKNNKFIYTKSKYTPQYCIAVSNVLENKMVGVENNILELEEKIVHELNMTHFINITKGNIKISNNIVNTALQYFVKIRPDSTKNPLNNNDYIYLLNNQINKCFIAFIEYTRKGSGYSNINLNIKDNHIIENETPLIKKSKNKTNINSLINDGNINFKD